MQRKLHLLIIDPQNDFCDLPASYLPRPLGHLSHLPPITPALPVLGAHADMLRLAQLIEQGQQGITGISITLDTHHIQDIAHPSFWQQANGSVLPFTTISAAQVRAGQYMPREAAGLQKVLSYLDALETSARYQLMIWPTHCTIGSWGHNVHADVHAACQQWQTHSLRNVNFVNKGQHPWTEHYSAIQAEVPDPATPETGLNHTLLHLLAQQDRIYIAGEASSHCVKATTEHIIANIGAQHIHKLVLLTDCISPVSGFENAHQTFIASSREAGVQIASSGDILPELLANSSQDQPTLNP
jgi:nicotinamidase/pyrazinamidase